MGTYNAPTANIVTPAGRAVWPKLNEPDTKFKENGEYSVTLCLAWADAEPLVEIIDRLIGENLEAAKAENPRAKLGHFLPYSPELDEESEEETGNILFKFKMPATVKSRRTGNMVTLRPRLFDASNKPCDVEVGGGSIIKVSAQVRGYYAAAIGAGVKLSMECVQVLELKQWAGDASPFSAQSDGFIAEEPHTTPFTESASAPSEF